ncbi:MAG: hypothetical protein HW380_2390 [Magnetococcales bacterium]|nr:hypothetical protein [Magnetococcales bacterium]
MIHRPPVNTGSRHTRNTLADQATQLAKLTAAIEAMARPQAILVQDQVEQAVKVAMDGILATMVERQVAVKTMISVKKILDEQKIPSKARNALLMSASHSLRDYCLQQGKAAKEPSKNNLNISWCGLTLPWHQPIVPFSMKLVAFDCQPFNLLVGHLDASLIHILVQS